MFRSESIAFLIDEKAPYVSDPYKVVLDLRKSRLTVLIGRLPDMPVKACPPGSIADLLEIKPSGKVHRFDVMGVAEMNDVRYHNVRGVRTVVVDVTVIDGAEGRSGKTPDMSFPVFVPAGPGDSCTEPMQQLLKAHGKVLSFLAINAIMESSKIADWSLSQHARK